MKTGNSYYMQLSRVIFSSKYESMSKECKWLFVVLNELEQRYTNGNTNYFYRSDEELADDCGWSVKTLKRYKAELKHYPELVRIGYVKFIDRETKKQSEKKITCYTILK